MLGVSILTDDHCARPELEGPIVRRKESIKRGRGETTIDILPDDVLLTVFFLHKVSSFRLWWMPLVWVCRRWRHIIFASPLRLNLSIFCTPTTPVKTSLDIWPPFPIAVCYYASCKPYHMTSNVIAALRRRDRVTEILFECSGYELESCFKVMGRPFVALTDLSLEVDRDDESVLPDDFLGGSAPSLRTLRLKRIAFPALPRLLSSTTQLVTLQLHSIPTIGYMSPGLIATCLAALPNLEQLDLKFLPSDIDTDEDIIQPRLLPTAPARLHTLTSFCFEGIIQYLEDLLVQIDTPVLQTLSSTFHDDFIHIPPQLLRFISCAERLSPPIEAIFRFDYHKVHLQFISSNGFKVTIIYKSTWGVLSMARVCREISPLISQVEHLHLQCTLFLLPIAGHKGWLQLFQPFIAVQNLYLSKHVLPDVVPVLRELIGERTTEVLPELRILFVEEFEKSWDEHESIQSFIAARTLSNRPVVVQQCTASGRWKWYGWMDDRL